MSVKVVVVVPAPCVATCWSGCCCCCCWGSVWGSCARGASMTAGTITGRGGRRRELFIRSHITAEVFCTICGWSRSSILSASVPIHTPQAAFDDMWLPVSSVPMFPTTLSVSLLCLSSSPSTPCSSWCIVLTVEAPFTFPRPPFFRMGAKTVPDEATPDGAMTPDELSEIWWTREDLSRVSRFSSSSSSDPDPEEYLIWVATSGSSSEAALNCLGKAEERKTIKYHDM